MERGERIRKRDADRIGVNMATPSSTKVAPGDHSRGTLLLRSGLSFPRMPMLLSPAPVCETFGHVADYYDDMEAAERWLMKDGNP
jgi:hypothetical protein